MAPHLTGEELDFINSEDKKGKTPLEIHEKLSQRRPRKNLAALHETNVRKADL